MNGRPDNGLFKASIIIVICAYMMLGQLMLPSGIGWNPQFNLKTFAQKNNEASRYELRFTSIEGVELAEPLYFLDAADMLTSDDLHEGRKIINRLGIALFDNDLDGIEQVRLELEEVYFGNFVSANYDIVFIDMTPVEKYSLEAFTSERIVSQFTHPLANPLTLDQFSADPFTN